MPGHAYNVPGLTECMAKVPRLLGCEAAYYFPQDVDICPAPKEEAIEVGRDRNESRGGGLEEAGTEAAAGVVGVQEENEGRHKGAGNLVIHIRSGDIFQYSANSYGSGDLLQHLSQMGYGQVRGDENCSVYFLFLLNIE